MIYLYNKSINIDYSAGDDEWSREAVKPWGEASEAVVAVATT